MPPTAAGCGRFPVVAEPPEEVHDGIGTWAPHRAVVDDMVRVATIEVESIVRTMLEFCFS